MILGTIGLALALSLIPQSEHRIPLVLGPEPVRVEIVKESDALIEHRSLRATTTPTLEQRRRLAAVEIALATIPNRCDEGQRDAGLCVK